jgi:hypothetical protein
MRISMLDPVQAIREIGKGVDPASVALGYTDAGYIDLRGLVLPQVRIGGRINTPMGPVKLAHSKPIFKGCHLKKVDLSGATIADSYWEDFLFEDVRMERVNARGAAFSIGGMNQVTFAGADLRDSAWGHYGVAGPEVRTVDFTHADLRGAGCSHPLFSGCKFIQSRLDGIDFRGSRFEDCTFEGRFADLWFRERFRDPDPRVAALRNEMKNVDFSRAELVFPSFLGVDLRSAKLPATGHLRIPNPRAVFSRALEHVQQEWTAGEARDKAVSYLNKMIEYQFRQEIPLYVIRPRDLSESPLGDQVGAKIVRELERATEEEGLEPH